MFDTPSLIGGLILGGIIATIFTLALTTAYWLYNGKETKQADDKEKEVKIKRAIHSNGGIRYGDGLDIEDWL